MQFVYFDVGGVLIKDFSATDKWDKIISEWGIPNERKNEITKRFDDFEKEVTVGKNVEEFLLILENEFSIKMPESYSINEDFVGRFYKNKGLEKIIERIQDKYKLGLLTNMYPGMLNLIKEKKILPEINWAVIVDSSIVRHRKPEMEIYKIAQEKSGVEAKEILFIDNKKVNLENAQKLGWQTFYYNSADYEGSNKELEEFLR